METMPRLGEKIKKKGGSRLVFTRGTANSACSAAFYARISGIQAKPLKYTNPDGKDIIYQNSSGNVERIEKSGQNIVHTPQSDKALMDANVAVMKENYLNQKFFYNNTLFIYTLDFAYNISGIRSGFRTVAFWYFIYKPWYSKK
jgi:hypothetical protein